MIKLPQPKYKSSYSIEECIKNRSSVRDYKDSVLTINEVSQLLWAAQGMLPEAEFRRTAPSAGATYPLFIYIVAGRIEGLEPGLYKYQPQNHSLERIIKEDIRISLSEATLSQEYIASAPLSVVITADYKRTTARYGERGIRYVLIEVGHAGENVCLQCKSLGLGTVAIGAFEDPKVSKVLQLPKDEKPLYIMPVGRVK